MTWISMFKAVLPKIFLANKHWLFELFINRFIIDNNFHNLSSLGLLSSQNAKYCLHPTSQMCEFTAFLIYYIYIYKITFLIGLLVGQNKQSKDVTLCAIRIFHFIDETTIVLIVGILILLFWLNHHFEIFNIFPLLRKFTHDRNISS